MVQGIAKLMLKVIVEKRMNDDACKDCGHSLTDHLRDLNGIVNCQVCERSGRSCG